MAASPSVVQQSAKSVWKRINNNNASVSLKEIMRKQAAGEDLATTVTTTQNGSFEEFQEVTTKTNLKTQGNHEQQLEVSQHQHPSSTASPDLKETKSKKEESGSSTNTTLPTEKQATSGRQSHQSQQKRDRSSKGQSARLLYKPKASLQSQSQQHQPQPQPQPPPPPPPPPPQQQQQQQPQPQPQPQPQQQPEHQPESQSLQNSQQIMHKDSGFLSFSQNPTNEVPSTASGSFSVSPSWSSSLLTTLKPPNAQKLNNTQQSIQRIQRSTPVSKPQFGIKII
jgi:hypothetical protein